MRDFKGKKVLITGAASGIGRATALAMGRLGGRLFLMDIDAEGLRKTVETLAGAGGEVCVARTIDVGDFQAMEALAREIHAAYGALDILINVAGVALFSQIEDMQHRDWEKIVKVNLWGVIHGLECFVPEMIRAGRGGHIVSVSSTAGLIGLPWHVAYAGTKHALVGMSEVLRYDLRKHRIGVTVVCPGAVNTGLVNTAEIHGQNTRSMERARKFFVRIAIAPEKVADLIVKAIHTQKFLVITSWDIKWFYGFKKYCFPLYHVLMMALSRFLDRHLK